MTEHLSVAGATHQCSLEISVSDSNKIRLRRLTKQSLLYLFRDPQKGAPRAARRLQFAGACNRQSGSHRLYSST
jgi:hypothetical protein